MAKKQPKSIATHSKEEVQKVKLPSFYSWKDWAMLGAILFTCYLTFSNVKNFQFVNWDDDRNFYENQLITSLNSENFWSNTARIFKEDVIGNYNPLTIWTFALEKRFYGKGNYNGLESPGSWHHTNLILHLICVMLVFFISRRLGLGWIGAAFATALFALHPMRVESVAWVTERKDVLYGMFFLAALLQYIRSKEKATFLRTFSIYLFFILSLFSKIQAVVLPLAMIAVDFLLDEKVSWQTVIKKWPYFLISFLWGVFGIFVLSHEGSLDTNEVTYAFWQRIFIGTYSYLVYVVKSVVPWRMSPLYPYPPTIPAYFYPTILVFPTVLFLGWQAFKKNWRVFGFSLAFFTFNIMFLLQILGAGQGFIADRFTYIAYYGMFFGFGYLVDWLSKKQNGPAISGVIGVLVIGIYSTLTYGQVAIWEHSGTLWTHVLKYYNQTTLPFGNRANYYRSQKMYDEALIDYDKAIKLKEDPQTFNSRARLYFDTATDSTRLLLALRDYNKAIELKPDDGEFWVNRGATYARLGNLDKAIENINTGLKFKPDHETGYLNRSVLNSALAARYPQGSQEFGDFTSKAIADIDEYQKFRPYNGDTWYEKARMKRSLGNLMGAMEDINRAIQIDASKGIYYYERAIENNLLNHNDQAKIDLQTAISSGYNNIDAAVFSAIQGNQ